MATITSSDYKRAARVKKALKLIATAAAIEEEKPVPAPVGLVLAHLDEAGWLNLARVAQVNPPSEETRVMVADMAIVYEQTVKNRATRKNPIPR